jgi:hypothetical protein
VASNAAAAVAGGDEVHEARLTFHYYRAANFVITWDTHGLSYALVSSISESARESCLVCHQNIADRDIFQQH